MRGIGPQHPLQKANAKLARCQLKIQQCANFIMDPKVVRSKNRTLAQNIYYSIMLNLLILVVTLSSLLSCMVFLMLGVGFILFISWNLGSYSLISFPTELFMWPQSIYFGGSGYPESSSMQIAELYHHCPTSSLTSLMNEHHLKYKNEESMLNLPRWIIQDSPCINISHLDAGVCIAEKTPHHIQPNKMKCLPSFLIIGAQKAGSTDLRGLLSFHPFLDGPSSEVRFFAHLNDERELNERWREYLDWFPEWEIPQHENGLGKLDNEISHSEAHSAHQLNIIKSTSGGGTGGSGTGAQFTYEKSPAYFGNEISPKLVSLFLPSIKIIVILRNPSSRAYSAFQHNCRFKRWKVLEHGKQKGYNLEHGIKPHHHHDSHAEPTSNSLGRRLRSIAASKSSVKSSVKKMIKQEQSLAINDVDNNIKNNIKNKLTRKLTNEDNEEDNLIINCDIPHDIKFEKKHNDQIKKEHHNGCDIATLLNYPCQPSDFHLLLKQQNYHEILFHYNKEVNNGKLVDRNGQPIVIEYMNKLAHLKSEVGSLINKGLYSYHLRDWLKYFNKKQIKILLFEDFYKQGASSSINGITDFLKVPKYDIEKPIGQSVYNWYNNAQRVRNHYEPMKEESRDLLNQIFCDPNKDLVNLLKDQFDMSLETKHGYACV
mmetsp:Transcript_43454/g.55806  ORF Transcript_43454/g.55806 Transcript_43454/m.55806 type:complete len:654 (+) Transcript_43454:125-2086(+)